MKLVKYISTALYALPFVAGAATIPTYQEVTGITGPVDLISKAANLFATIIMAVSVVMLLYAGFQYITAAGDSKKTEAGKNGVIYAIIGLFIAAMAYLLPTWIPTLLR